MKLKYLYENMLQRALTGLYYWVPRPDGSWYVKVFRGPDYYNVTHPEAWREVLPILADEWDIDYDQLNDYICSKPYGLPRGRIIEGPRLLLLHGNDSPGDLIEVIDNFGLQEDQVKIEFDSHEQCYIDHVRDMGAILGIDLSWLEAKARNFEPSGWEAVG